MYDDAPVWFTSHRTFSESYQPGETLFLAWYAWYGGDNIKFHLGACNPTRGQETPGTTAKLQRKYDASITFAQRNFLLPMGGSVKENLSLEDALRQTLSDFEKPAALKVDIMKKLLVGIGHTCHVMRIHSHNTNKAVFYVFVNICVDSAFCHFKPGYLTNDVRKFNEMQWASLGRAAPMHSRPLR
eukprot:gene11496-13589_t